jgi:hypothetical protein
MFHVCRGAVHWALSDQRVKETMRLNFEVSPGLDFAPCLAVYNETGSIVCVVHLRLASSKGAHDAGRRVFGVGAGAGRHGVRG